MADVEKLLPCPFCGEQPSSHVEEGTTFRWRRVAGCCTPGPEVRLDTLAENEHEANADALARAIAAWNRRALTPSEADVERVAEAMHDALYDKPGDPKWEASHENVRRQAIRMARAAIAAMSKA